MFMNKWNMPAMDRLSTENIKQEVDDDRDDQRVNCHQQQQTNATLNDQQTINTLQQSNAPTGTETSSTQNSVCKSVKKEDKDDQGAVVKSSKKPCTKVKKEEVGDGECIKLEWDGDECDCEECRVDRQIKVEFNQNNNSLQQGNRCPGTSSEAKKGVPSQSSVCKRVKKEEDEDGEWDEDCDCDDCRRMRLKAIQLKQTNVMQNRGTGDDDGEETEIDEDGNGSEDVLVGIDGNMAVGDQIGDENGDELDQEGEQSGDGQESSEDQMSDADDETEIDDEEYEMKVGGEESQTVEDAPIEATLPHRNGQTRKIVRQSVRHLKRKQTDDKIASEYTTNPIPPNLAQSNRHLQCPHCLKSFDRNSNFQTHLRVHTGERPFPCDLCDKRFKERNKLTRHQLIHQNIKRFRCHECDKQFTQKHSLNSHLLTHSGERPFKCRHCEMTFTKSNTRTTHEQAIHLHVKPYRCKQYAHSATQHSTMIQHIRVIHFGLPLTIKEQRALNIIDERDPGELVEKV